MSLPLSAASLLADRPRGLTVPHLFPYQGSKRRLAAQLLSQLRGRRFARIIEPFAGSAALTLAAAHGEIAPQFMLGDSLVVLMELWGLVLTQPEVLAERYRDLWEAQQIDPRAHYLQVRETFNAEGDPAMLLYLLCRCVKSAPRFNAAGDFNQSADHRRLGSRPEKIRAQALAISALLGGRTHLWAGDFRELCAQATADDLLYLDPPWAGTTYGRDKRYHAGLSTESLIEILVELQARGVPFMLSYDGRTGERRFGPELPAELGMRRVELRAGRSTQATLLGRQEQTVESLYLSHALS